MSKSFANDPAVSAMLVDYDMREHEEVVKGFPEPIGIVQIRP